MSSFQKIFRWLLYDGENYIFIHVDKRNDYLHREMKDVESKFPDLIHVTDQRRNIVWGGTSMLLMLLRFPATNQLIRPDIKERWEKDKHQNHRR